LAASEPKSDVQDCLVDRGEPDSCDEDFRRRHSRPSNDPGSAGAAWQRALDTVGRPNPVPSTCKPTPAPYDNPDI